MFDDMIRSWFELDQPPPGKVGMTARTEIGDSTLQQTRLCQICWTYLDHDAELCIECKVREALLDDSR